MTAGRTAARWGLVGLLLVASLAGGLWLWRCGATLAPWQPANFLPKDAKLLAWSEPMGTAADGLVALTRRVQGLAGTLQAVQLAVGVDVADADSVERAGLRRDAGMTVALWRGAVWVAMPVRGRPGVEHWLEQLRRRGYEVSEPTVESGPQALTRWVVTGRGEDRAEKLRIWDADGTALAAQVVAADAVTPTVAEFMAAPKVSAESLTGRRGVLHALYSVSPGDPLATRMHQLLGPGDFLLGAAVDRLQRAELDVAADAGGLRATLKLLTAPGKLKDIADYHAGFVAVGAELAVGDLLPDETPLLLRARVNPALWSALPEAVQALVLPQWALQVVHPSLSGVDARQLLGDIDGQLAVGVLAVADAVPLDPRMWPQLSWRTAIRPFLVLSMKSDVAARTWLERVRTALETSPDRPASFQFGAWSGFSVPGPGAPWWLLQRGKSLAFLSGQGTADDLRRLSEGKIASLDKAVGDGIERKLVAGMQRGDGILLTTPRVVRSLRRRGVPDYATGLLGAVEAAALTVELGPNAIEVELAVRPGADDAEASQQVRGNGEAP